MVRDYNTIMDYAKKIGPRTVAVACAEDADLIKGIEKARTLELANVILIGNKKVIENILKDNNIDKEKYDIIDVSDKKTACDKAIWHAKTGRATIIVKGTVDTDIILNSIYNKELGLEVDESISRVDIIRVDEYDRLIILSGSPVNKDVPSLEEKAQIIVNAVSLAHLLNIQTPKVAIENSQHSMELIKMNEEGKIKGCIINCPIISEKDLFLNTNAADILIVSEFDKYFNGYEKLKLIMGVESPIVIYTETETVDSIINSIALAAMISDKK